ncbi:MAG TPA: TIGR03000 domain-containing protein [Gemmataceae bacterium]|nr:TIGR03000 domain-containing protein [Gemmataceae bacterium]
MKKFLMIVAVATVALLADSQLASARRGGCGGGGRGGRHGGCGGGCGGSMMGGCGMGGCGMGGCGMGGGYAMGGCATCGGGYVMGGGACPGGVCSIGGGATSALALLGSSTEATLIVNLPEDATLTIDGEATTSTSAQRVFVTPTLEQGKEYEYTLKAQVVRDGKPQIATAKVTVRPGETSQVELKVPAAGVAAQ